MEESPDPFFDHIEKSHAGYEALQEHDDQKKNDGRDIDAAQVRHEASDRPQRGFRQIVKNASDGVDHLVVRIHDVEHA